MKRRAGDGHDATRVDLGRGFTATFPCVRGRNESIAYYPFTVEAEPVLDYVESDPPQGRLRRLDRRPGLRLDTTGQTVDDTVAAVEGWLSSGR